MPYDVIILGGSYAGMAAALQIARARRRVLVIDQGLRRNRFAAHSHGFLGQDGKAPDAIARQARDQLLAYPTVDWLAAKATGAAMGPKGCEIALADGSSKSAHRLIIACGVHDKLPPIPGLQERWGKTAFHCPYCHGYELQGPLGVVATGPASFNLALLLSDWGSVTLFLNGTFKPDPDQTRLLDARRIRLETAPVHQLRGHCDLLLGDGRTVALSGVFVMPHVTPASSLVFDLGCALDQGPQGTFIRTDDQKRTTVPGVYACGDAARATHSVSFAVGDGALAGQSAHRSLVLA